MTTALLTPGLQSTAPLVAGTIPPTLSPAGPNSGVCSLSFQDRVFRFRTNPNEISWTYELITHVEDTYGGKVVQLLGTKLGDFTIKVEIGNGGWPYLMQVVLYLRDLMSDQRNGNVVTFNYTTRNWMLNLYAMNIPFQDSFNDTVREIELNFKVQQDVNGLMQQVTLDMELQRLTEGVYGPGQPPPHSQFSDFAAGAGNNTSDNLGPGGPTYTPPNITNTVDSTPQGDNPGGINIAQGIPGMPNIPGLGNLAGITGLLGGL